MSAKIKLYNTASRKLEEFHPQNPEDVKVYTCGPTVYAEPHVGNYAAYIYWDLLVRMLRANGYKVRRVLNYTDVGHLVSDADEGEDKLEKGARKSGKTVWEIAEHYIDIFNQSMDLLNLLPPDVGARATDYIEQDIALVDKLTEKGYTYETSDGIYFDTAKFARYADFARLDLEGLKAGARVEFNSEKHNPSDFAVWKFIAAGEDHAMRWDYLGRPGYPGWHLECSTIIHAVLGEPIDIHTGGVDHIPVHHTNEIAQSEAAYDKQLSRYWLHCKHIMTDGQKISKSLGNVYTLSDLQARGISPLDFKMWALSGHYQGERNFSLSDLEAAKNHRLGWRNSIALSRQKQHDASRNKHDQDLFEDLLVSTSDNLHSADAFAKLDAYLKQHDILNLDVWQKIDDLFGLGLITDSPNITREQLALLDARAAARSAKDYQRSDELRDELAKTGLTVLDTADGQVWQYVL